MRDNSNKIGLTKAGVVVTDTTTGLAQVTFTNAFEKGVSYSVSLSIPDPGLVRVLLAYPSNLTNIGFTITSYDETGGAHTLEIAGGKTVYWIAVPMFD